uniref:beta-galactosidase trimerization domain-containing protein n=1 Tax=Aliiroseovarius sp. TaxID=1872442 RepID=UPI00262049FC
YCACRKLGLSLDILPPSTRDFTGYKLVLAPGLMHVSDELKSALTNCDGRVVLGPRAAARTAEMQMPVPLAPSIPGLDVTVSRVESLRPDMPLDVEGGGAVQLYREELEGTADVTLRLADGAPLVMRAGRVSYLGGWLDQDALLRLLRKTCAEVGIATLDLPDGLRLRDTGTERFWFNHTPGDVVFEGRKIPAAGVLREA